MDIFVLTVNTNLDALTAYRFLATTERSQSEAVERLSSGLRINGAADDAAGLAISEGLLARINGGEQAQRNALDGANMLQTADGALAETQSILQRMRVLAVQAANDSNDEAARRDLQTEVDGLDDELDQIAGSTAFNGIPLLDGSFVGKKFQVGSGAQDAVQVDLPGRILVPEQPYVAPHPVGVATLTLSGPADDDWVGADTDPTNGLGVITLSNDGHSAQVDLSTATDAKSAYALMSAQLAGTDFAAGFNDETGSIMVTTTYSTADDLVATGGNVGAVTGESQAWELGSHLTVSTGLDALEPLDAGGDGSVPDLRQVASVALTLDGHSLTIDLTGANQLTDDDETYVLAQRISDAIAADPATAHDASGAGPLYQVQVYGYQPSSDITYTLADGSTTTYRFPGGRSGIGIRSLYPNHYPDEQVPMSVTFTAADGSVIYSGDGGYGSPPGGVDSTTGYLTGEVPYQAARYAAFDSTGLETRTGVDLTTQQHAEDSIATIDAAISSISTTRAYLGATQNRLQHTVDRLTTGTANLEAARSTITDADMAEESAKLARAQVLQGAGTAMLKQAKAPNAVLALLQS